MAAVAVAQLALRERRLVKIPADPEWVDLSIVVEEKTVRELIPRLYDAGARGIIELPINKIVE